MAGAGAFAALERTPLALAMREGLWLFPVVEIVHIVGFVVLVGGIVALDLRLLGLSRSLSVRAFARHVLPWSIGALLLIIPTGLLMFMAQAAELINNRAFHLKLLLILLAGLNAAAFHIAAASAAAQWDQGGAPPLRVRLHAAVSLALWTAVIACGRLLAYV